MESAPDLRNLRRIVSFWLIAGLAVAFLFAASAPSPIYPLYQRSFGFSTITVTAIYAVYAASGLIGLLVFGRLSDYVGRRPVALLALVVQIAGMLAFIAAQDETMLYVGRLVQGLATGIGIAVLSAWLVDLQPPDSPGLGALVGSTAAMVGLGAGALGSGLLVEFAPHPTLLVYWLLIVVYVLGLVVISLAPDRAPRRPGWSGALRPEVGVPIPVRPLFVAHAPSMVALWSLAGFYLSLVPALMGLLLGGNSPVASGLIIVALLGTASVSAVATQRFEARRTVLAGSMLLVAGVAVSLTGVVIGSAPALYLGSVVAGIGFGPAFTAIVRSLIGLAPPDRRGALLAAVYIVVYVSFSVPAVMAGVAVTAVGLQAATLGYGVIVIALAAITAGAVARTLR